MNACCYTEIFLHCSMRLYRLPLTLLFLSFLLRFTPEQLGLSASSLLVWLAIELLIIYLGLFLAQVTSQLSWMDLLAYCTYKYTRWVWFLRSHDLNSSCFFIQHDCVCWSESGCWGVRILRSPFVDCNCHSLF